MLRQPSDALASVDGISSWDGASAGTGLSCFAC